MLKKKIMGLAFACMLVLALPGVAFAATSTTSSSTGTLTVKSVSCSDSADVKDGDTINAVDQITLTFSDNIASDDVIKTNQTLVTLTDSNGNAVDATVSIARASESIYTATNIVVVAQEALPAGSYTLTAKAGITSESGSKLASDYTLHFTSSGVSNWSTGPDRSSYGTDTTTSSNSTVIVAVIAVIIVIVLALVVVFLMKRNEKKE